MWKTWMRTSTDPVADCNAATLSFPPWNPPGSLLFVQGTVQTVLDQLADSGAITRKEFGKSKIYVAPPPALDPTELARETAALESRWKALQEEKSQWTGRKGSLEGEVRRLNQGLDDTALETALTTLIAENAAREETLEKLRLKEGKREGRAPMDKLQMKRLEEEVGSFRKVWAARKRQAMEAVECVADGAGKRVIDIIDMMGIETDEEAGVSLPALGGGT